ncbi:MULTISPECIES: CDP-alcohol phosphatidyltransferase family protein [Cryobacterium]|nr:MULTISPECIES: CDP-alcohol phosphatidyltransferase family protein [Cryobacterium]
MTPNQVTALSALATGAGLALLVSGEPSPLRAVGVTVLLILGFALDSADGQVARLTGRGSAAGEWLDHVVDAGKVVAVHAAILITAFRFWSVEPIWYLVPLAFQVVSVVTFVGGLLMALLLRRSAKETPTTPANGEGRARRPSRARAIALLPADYGILSLSFILTGWPGAFVVAYSLLLAANTLVMALLLGKWFRTLSARG